MTDTRALTEAQKRAVVMLGDLNGGDWAIAFTPEAKRGFPSLAVGRPDLCECGEFDFLYRLTDAGRAVAKEMGG